MEEKIILALGKLSEALVLEKEYELQQYESLLQQTSISERRKEGYAWFPVSLSDRKFALSSVPLIKLERNPSDRLTHLFQNGSSVAVFSSDEELMISGVIHKIEESHMWVALNSDDIPNWLEDDRIGVNVTLDSKTFFEMERAMNILINAEGNRIAELRNIMYGSKKSSLKQSYELKIPLLNENQNKAVNLILNSEDVVIIHGPPGTGKTTTIVEAIKQLSKKERRILVCAPSNAAVDHLTKKIKEKGLNVTRVGNLAKVDDDLFCVTLDGKLEKLPEFKQISNYKRQAIEIRAKAEKFKRNFGPKEREERRLLYKEARDLLRESRELENFIAEKIIDESDVVCTTLIGSTNRFLRDLNFNTVFIDEAAQGLEPACWVPILKANKVVLAGDPFQLPPTVKCHEAKKMGLSETLMEKTMKSANDSVLLNVQYRMNEKIMEFSNYWFYSNKLVAHESVIDWKISKEENPIEFIDTAGCGFDEKTEEGKYSKSNPGEVEVLIKRLNDFHGDEQNSIGIISPYKGQVNQLHKSIVPSSNITINTIDSFQGQERDIIIISLVRSNPDGDIGFLKDYRRMNVAMTRAKKKLVIIGDSSTVGQDKFYNEFLNFCESNDFYKSAWEFMY